MARDFIGNYLQHITDIFLDDGLKYEDISDAYNQQAITEEGIQKSHVTLGRGNLPRRITPELFYQKIFLNYYEPVEDQKQFARQLHAVLTRDNLFPSEWEKRRERIDGFSDAFDADIFHTFIVYLLSQDKKARRNEKKLSELAQGRISIQKGTAGGKKQVEKGNEVSPLTFSQRFFNEGAHAIASYTDEMVEDELERLSSVFRNIVSLDFADAETAFSCHDTAFLVKLRDYVLAAVRKSDRRDILKIKGPLGSYKNRIMQYLYIAVEKKADTFLPFYIDIASYEKAAEENERIGEKDFLRAFEKDIVTIEQIIAMSPEKTPLLMLDGIRDFSYRREALYYSIKKRIQPLNCALILCMDTDFTVNNQNKYTTHPLDCHRYGAYLRIRSMNLNRRAESIEFIRNCIRVFSPRFPDRITPEQIYDHLVRMDFLTIDAYWLTHLIDTHLNDILDHKNDIASLYDSICLKFLGSNRLMESASEFAYEFEFGKPDTTGANPYFDTRWLLIRKHRSVLDFLIAKRYIKKVSELNLQGGTQEENKRSLAFFNMVLQKNITRFVVAMLKGVDDYERQIMIIAKNHYDDLALFGKSELTFWMARLQNPMRKKECVRLLRSYNEKERAYYRQNQFANPEEKRNAAFLLRGINVSLIYEDDEEALRYYLESLLTDKVANSVNRGFHLEYYGDKPYIPSKTLLDFEDDVRKGEATLTVLCLSLDRRIRRGDVSSPVAPLEIMTLCNLLQARIECCDEAETLDVSPYIEKCLRYLEWIMRQRVLKGLKDVCVYFHWMYNELTALAARNKGKGKRIEYSPASLLNKFGRASHVDRTGWVDMGIRRPENIVEHMYNCWLIGLLYLPDTSDHPEYNKNDVLKMLLIHDLGEAETGDISRPKKRENQSFYDHQERIVMQGLLLSGTYPNAASLHEYLQLWNQWDERQSFNYAVGKDIDNIQTIYQFLAYYIADPGRFSEEQLRYWLCGLREIETDIGKDIADLLIVRNPSYRTIVEPLLLAE